MSTAIDTTESCASCGVPLANDQRYCLNCGERRGNARLPFLDVLHDQWAAEHPAPEPAAAAPPPEPPEPKRNWTPLVAAAAGGAIALVLGIGFVIGQSGDDPPTAQRPQVIQVGGGGGSSTQASATTFTSDWPDGQTGWTVQLQELPKDSTQPDAVAAAKTAAAGKGVKEIGALDSDATQGFDTGEYVIYSGVFNSEKDAKKRLSEVKGSFPDAKVVQVGGSSSGDTTKASDKSAPDAGKKSDALKSLDNAASPEDYQKKSRKLPDEVSTGGKAPPKDTKAPGAGSGVEEIK